MVYARNLFLPVDPRFDRLYEHSIVQGTEFEIAENLGGQSAVALSNESNGVPLSFRALVKRCHRAVVAGVVIPCLCMCVCVIVCIAVDPETQHEHH